MAQIIKAGTKRAENLLASANWNQGTELRDIYASWSRAKEEAMLDCKRKRLEENGDNFRITGHNCNTFSVAWEFDYVDPITRVVTRATHIETAYNTYIVLHE